MAFKAQVKTSPGLIVEVEAPSQKELFKAIAKASEVFGEKQCGQCGSTNIRFAHRQAGGFDFFECACNECPARLSYSQSNEGNKDTVFPNRRLMPNGKPGNPKKKEGAYGKHNGWTTFRGDTAEEE